MPRALAAAILVPALLLAPPLAAQTPPAPTSPAVPATPDAEWDHRVWLPVAAGLGAIVGVVGFNVLALGFSALPGGGLVGASPAVAAEMSVAISRVYATTSAVVGGLVANYAYVNSVDPEKVERARGWPIDPQILAIGAGAIVGAVTFNIASAPLGMVPLAGGPLAAVPMETALGSRLIAGTSIAAGAIGATAAYDWVTGHASDYGKAAALAAGAFGGIALGNVLTGSFGTVPYYAGAGEAVAAAGTMASAAAQASSRIYVVASGVLGAWAADWLWGPGEPQPQR